MSDTALAETETDVTELSTTDDSALPADTDPDPKPTPTPVTTETTVDFNITIALGANNEQVTIYAKDLANIPTKGMHFALPPGTKITLGSLKSLIAWLNTQLAAAGAGITIPVNADGWPEALASIYNGVLNTVVKVDKFTLDQDPKKGDISPPMRFQLEVSGLAMDPADPTKPKPIPVLGLFSVVGGGIGLTRTYPGAPAEVLLSAVNGAGLLPSGT